MLTVERMSFVIFMLITFALFSTFDCSPTKIELLKKLLKTKEGSEMQAALTKIQKLIDEQEKSLKGLTTPTPIVAEERDLPETKMTVCEMAVHNGFQCETHYVETADGYILKMHRIPNRNTSKLPIIFQHGLLDSSAAWVMNPRNQSAAYVFSDAGFDVWMGNNRGNKYSRSHKTLNVENDAFWDFSWQDMAKYDIPAIIDYVTDATEKSQVFYVGYSQGALVGLASFSENKTTESKVKMMIGLGPAITAGHTTSVVKYIAPFTKTLQVFFGLFGVKEFLPNTWLNRLFGSLMCQIKFANLGALCGNVAFLILGTDGMHLDKSRIPIYVSNIPAGSSVRNVAHFGQLINKKTFTKYDFGEMVNKRIYGQTIPPLYYVENITIPVSIYWGGRDKMANPTDVGLNLPKFQKLEGNHFIPTYEHLDFIWATNAKTYVYDTMIEEFSKKMKTL